MITEDRNINSLINEGLIMTYDINKCKSFIKKKFNEIKNIRLLTYNPYAPKNRSKSKYKADDFVAIDLGTDYQNYKEIEKTCSQLLGWFVSHIDIISNDKGNYRPYRFNNFNGEFDYEKYEMYLDDYLATNPKIVSFSLIIEKKFPHIYEADKNTMFYHATNLSVLKKILKQGLVPRTEGNFPERIYLGRDIEDIREMVGEHFKENGVILKINVEGIVLYQDPRQNSAVFTLQNIPPSRIQIFKPLYKKNDINTELKESIYSDIMSDVAAIVKTAIERL